MLWHALPFSRKMRHVVYLFGGHSMRTHTYYMLVHPGVHVCYLYMVTYVHVWVCVYMFTGMSTHASKSLHCA